MPVKLHMTQPSLNVILSAYVGILSSIRSCLLQSTRVNAVFCGCSHRDPPRKCLPGSCRVLLSLFPASVPRLWQACWTAWLAASLLLQLHDPTPTSTPTAQQHHAMFCSLRLVMSDTNMLSLSAVQQDKLRSCTGSFCHGQAA